MTPDEDLLTAAKVAFGDDASSMTVPVSVVLDAAAHTFNMLDDEQKVELVEEAFSRWKAVLATKKALAGEKSEKQVAVQSGDTTVVYSDERNQMRDDLIYRLMHQRFDLVYAVAVRLKDAPEGPEHQQWLITPPRPDETETPQSRVAALLQDLIDTVRRGRQRFESLRASARARTT